MASSLRARISPSNWARLGAQVERLTASGLAMLARVHVRIKIFYYIYVSYMWFTVRRTQFKEIAKQRRLGRSAWAGPQIERTAAAAAQCSSAKRTQANEELGPVYGLKLGLVPELSRIGLYYYCFTTTVHIIMLILNTLFNEVIFDKTGKNYVMSCILPRFVISHHLNRNLIRQSSWSLSLIHIFWRFFMLFVKQDMQFDVLKFLLVDEDILERVRNATLSGAQFVPTGQDDIKLINSTRFACIRDYMFYRKQRATTSSGYVLRPNRTADAYRRLVKVVETTLSLTLLVAGFSGASLACSTFFTLLYRQHIVYPGCEIGSSFGAASLVRTWGSLLLFLVYVVDTLNSICFTCTVGFFITYDILMHWHHVNQDTEQLWHEMPNLRALIASGDRRKSKSICDGIPRNSIEHRGATLRPPMSCNGSNNYGCPIKSDDYRRAPSRSGHHLSERVNKLQEDLADFFQQLGRANHYINFLITFVLATWLALNSFVTLSGAQTDIRTSLVDQFVLRAFQTMGLSVIATISWLILGLKRQTQAGYTKLCSLMALDPSTNKTKWLRLLYYYTEKPEYGFTYLKDSLFTRLALMKYLSYTISFVLVVESLQLTKIQANLNLNQINFSGLGVV